MTVATRVLLGWRANAAATKAARREIRLDPALAGIPVVLLSGSPCERDALRAAGLQTTVIL